MQSIRKRKLKDEPLVVETATADEGDLMEDRAFFIQHDLMRAFVGPREAVRTPSETQSQESALSSTIRWAS